MFPNMGLFWERLGSGLGRVGMLLGSRWELFGMHPNMGDLVMGRPNPVGTPLGTVWDMVGTYQSKLGTTACTPQTCWFPPIPTHNSDNTHALHRLLEHLSMLCTQTSHPQHTKQGVASLHTTNRQQLMLAAAHPPPAYKWTTMLQP